MSVIGGGIGIAILATLWVYAKRSSKKNWKQFAEENAFRPVSGPVIPNEERKAIPFLCRGFTRKYLYPHERDFNGTLVRVFDYEYKFGAPIIANVSYAQTVIAVKPQTLNLPNFQLCATTTLDRLWGRISGQHIRPYVETNFSKRYVLRGRDRNSILALFRPEVVEAIEYQTPGTEWSVESGGGWLVFYCWRYLVPKQTLMDVIITNGYFANLITNQELIPQPNEEYGEETSEDTSAEFSELVQKFRDSPYRER